MVNQPDEARPPKKDDDGLGHKPEENSPKDTPVTATGDVAVTPTPAPTPGSEAHATGEGEVLVDRVEPGTGGADHHHEEHHDHHAHDHHAQDHDSHGHDDFHHDETYHDEHHHHEGHEQDGSYGGGTPAAAVAVAAYGGGRGGGGGEGTEGGDGEEEGGPVKSFLDHLEDLRWMLVKCSVAIGVAMLVCLIAGDYLMKVLIWPLERAEHVGLGSKRFVALMMEGTMWTKFKVSTNEFPPAVFGTNHTIAVQATLLQIGTNHVFALVPSTNAPPPLHKQLINLTPAGGFFVAFQLAIYGGLVIASPLVIYYLALFILPALRIKEKKYVLRGFGIGSFLFLLGVAFCYFFLMPMALNASAKYSEWLGISADMWTAEQYISFICKFMLGMGLGFEMPVVILCLVKIGIVNYQQLAAFRRYMIVINLILGAVLTTPEVLTQVMMAVPLQILYEISVWIAWYWDRQEKKKQALGGAS